MKFSAILREAVLNVVTGTSRAATFACVLACAVLLFGVGDAVATADVVDRVDAFRDAGGSTLVYRMKHGVDGAACDRLRTVPGVIASGAVRERETGLTARALPAQLIPTFDVSTGFGGFRALGSTGDGPGVAVSDEVATTLGVTTGDVLPLVGGEPRVRAVFRYPSDGRVPGYGYSVLVPSESSTVYDECWVEAWPLGESLPALLTSVLVPGVVGASGGATQGPRLQQLNASLGSHLDAGALFDRRVTRFGPPAVATVGLGLGVISVLRRRLELASARHAGVTATALVTRTAIETAIWATVGTLLALPGLAAAVVGAPPQVRESLSLIVLRIALAACLAAVLGAAGWSLTVRENRLFRDFKAR